jgi:hypothetical protein
VTAPRAQTASRMGSIRSLLARTWSGNRLFILVMVPAVLLRIDAELGYRWQVWFNDSFDYVQNTVHFSLDPTRPSGYSIFLKILEPFRTYALVTILQHLMGLAIAVMIYALARHRYAVPAWLATLATVPILFDGFEVQLEHLIMADVPFLFVATLALTIFLWQPQPSLLRCAVVGLLLGISDVIRSVALPMLIIFLVYMVIRWMNWRRMVAMAVMCALPVIAYAGAFDVEHGQLALTDSTGVFLYSRVMTFAECQKMTVPADEKWLCTNVPPDQRPIAQAYIWTEGAPIALNNQYTNPLLRLGPNKFSQRPNQLAENFAIRAILAQPLAYARTVFDDTWKTFGFKKTVFPNPATYDEYLFTRHPLGIPSYNMADLGPYKSYASAYIHGNPYTHVVQPFAGLMELYEHHVYLPGTLYGLILLVGLGGMVLAWRRWGGEALLPWTISLALIVVPAATAEFDYRYVLAAVPFGCLAAAMAFAPGTAGGAWARKLADRVRHTSPAGPGGGPDGPASAGHDQGDLAADGG